MIGANAQTGTPLTGFEHLAQSVRDILITPIGSRVMRREYGSELFRLIDSPLNPANVLRIYAAAAKAIRRWEPRMVCQRFTADFTPDATLSLRVEGQYQPTAEPVVIDVVIG